MRYSRAVLVLLLSAMLPQHHGVAGTRFCFGRPSPKRISRFLERQKRKEYNHKNIGWTKGQQTLNTHPVAPRGWKRVELRRELGEGERVYDLAKTMLLEWKMHEGSAHNGIVIMPTIDEREGTNPIRRELATLARTYLRFIWVLNPCRTGYHGVDEPLLDDNGNVIGISSYVSYATLRGHLLQGEERMRVGWIRGEQQSQESNSSAIISSSSNGSSSNSSSSCQETNSGNNTVFFDVVSISRGSGVIGSLVFPLCARMQDRFFTEQVDTMQKKAMPMHGSLSDVAGEAK
mmetsp:Transcript_34704/g.64245  ORF Transcript_34704/g.64245 Transcript_34704/m.64245 type:complete len:289 (-) Transcript_34704:168-1034(-)